MSLRAVLFLLIFLLPTLMLRAAAIAVVYAERSVPESERRFAKSLATHVQRWYADVGIETDLLPDSALTTRSAHKMTILVDCYNPPADLVTAVKTQMASGTRFVVCYSGSDALARIFGLKAGEYKRSADGSWSSMELLGNRPAGAPSEILQTSSNLFTVQPISRKARPMAWWRDRSGKRTDVAWWKTTGGSYWMTHILTGDGDESAKQRLLLALAAENVSGVWQSAARHLYNEAVGPLEDGSLLERIRLLPKTSERRKLLDRIYVNLRAQQKATQVLLTKDAFAAYQSVCDLRDLVARAYGMTYWSHPGEIRGIWDHTGQGLFPGNWERTAKLLSEHGITDVYVNVAGAAFARYPSKVLARKGTADCLGQAVAACRKYRLRVHAWMLSFSGELSAPDTLAEFKRKGWTLQDAQGTDLNWLDPTNPAVQAHLLAAVKEMASNYPVDGIHLDFIRYPGLPQTLGPRIRARFEANYGKVSNWPACVTDGNGPQRVLFLRWRTERISDAVQEVRSWLRRNKPGMQLSAAVFGKYPSCVDSVGQDWLSWLRTGLIDTALPMNYTEDLDTLRDWLGTQTSDPRLAARIVSGVGVTAAESRLGPIETLRQIEAARKAKCKGFALFDLDETLRRNILPVLSEGISKP